MAKSKCLTFVLILIVVGFIFFVFLPMWGDSASFTLTFYNEDGDVVNIPFSLVPYGVVTDGPGGQEIASFTVTVHTYTDDPLVGWCDFDIHLTVSYYADDSMPPEPVEVYTGMVFAQRTTVGHWEAGRSETVSPLIFVHSYLDQVPDNCGFYMEFTGNYRFFHTADVSSANPVFTGVMNPHTVSLYHDGYSYDAYFGT